MKIVHLNEHLSHRGGIETYLLSLIPRLEAQGHPQTVFFARGDADLVSRSQRLPCLAESSRDTGGDAYRETRALLQREQPDVIHIHNIYSIAAIRACLDTAPTIFTAHDYRYVCPASSYFFRRSRTICTRQAGLGCFCKALTQRCMTLRPISAMRYYHRVRWMIDHASEFARVIAPSDYCRERMIAAGFADGQVVTIPYFCPIAPLREPRAMPAQPLILFVGRGSPSKGYDVFVRALGRLPANVRGRIAGNFSPPRIEEINRLAAKCGCVDRLTIGGWIERDAIVDALSSASVLVFPSLWAETLGIIGLEALACGVPVVASDVGGVRQWLRHGENGLLTPPGDAAAMATAINDILASPHRSRAMGERGIETIREEFSPESHLASIVECYAPLSSATPAAV